jgi:dockerin type I repeat protein
MKRPRLSSWTLLALAALLGWGADAGAYVLVEAQTSSLAQASQQPTSSFAHVQNGVLVGGDNTAGPNGGSSAGPIGVGVTQAFANTTQIDGPILTISTAGVDFRTGKLRASADAGAAGPGFSAGIAIARMSDTITFNNTTGVTIQLPFFWNTHGVVTDSTGPTIGSSDITSSIVVSRNGTVSSSIVLKGNPNLVDAGSQFVYSNGSAGFSFAPNGSNFAGVWTDTLTGPASGLITATLLVPPGASAIDIATYISIDCRTGSACDYNNTAGFRFAPLPSGLSFTSESGAFLELYRHGDSNGDGYVDVLDIFHLINFLFAGGSTPVGIADVNNDQQINVQDVFYLINYLFAGGPAPV